MSDFQRVNLEALLEVIRSIGFWKRLFGWSSIRILGKNAQDELRKIEEGIRTLQTLQDKIKQLEAGINKLEDEKQQSLDKNRDLEVNLATATTLRDEYLKKNNELLVQAEERSQEIRTLTQETATLKAADTVRSNDHSIFIQRLTDAMADYNKQKDQLVKEKEEEDQEKKKETREPVEGSRKQCI